MLQALEQTVCFMPAKYTLFFYCGCSFCPSQRLQHVWQSLLTDRHALVSGFSPANSIHCGILMSRSRGTVIHKWWMLRNHDLVGIESIDESPTLATLTQVVQAKPSQRPFTLAPLTT